MPELRKRKAPEAAAPTPAKKANSAKSSGSVVSATSGSASKKIAVGESIILDGFGGEVETNDGETVTLKSLIEESQSGVVLFTYPKASTPGCTTQACLFRDDYASLTVTGFAIYGLSTDSPKANTAFKTKQKLPYKLLCDPKASLIAAIGMKKSPSGTTRGVFVVNKLGLVKAMAPGGPAATVDMVRELVREAQGAESINEGKYGNAEPKDANANNGKDAGRPGASKDKEEDKANAETAAQVADTAQKLDQ